MKYYVHCLSHGYTFALYTFDDKAAAVDKAHELLAEGIECRVSNSMQTRQDRVAYNQT